MIESAFEAVEQSSKILRLDLTSEEFAAFAESHDFSEEAVSAVAQVMSYLGEKKIQTTIRTILKMSRLPLKAPKTFENFDFNLIKGRDVDRLKALPSLSALYAHRNLAFIGPAGTGKTHLAQAFGYECCQRGFKTYFIVIVSSDPEKVPVAFPQLDCTGQLSIHSTCPKEHTHPMVFQLFAGHIMTQRGIPLIHQANQSENLFSALLVLRQQGHNIAVISIQTIYGQSVEQADLFTLSLPFCPQIGKHRISIRDRYGVAAGISAHANQLVRLDHRKFFRITAVGMQFNPIHGHSPIPKFD